MSLSEASEILTFIVKIVAIVGISIVLTLMIKLAMGWLKEDRKK